MKRRDKLQDQWLMKMAVLDQTDLPGSWDLINSDCIETLFGKEEWKTKYCVYVIVKPEEPNDIRVLAQPYDSLVQSVDFVKGKTNRVWHYIPNLKYIVYLEGTKFLCVDYGNLDGGNTPIVEIVGLKDPINDATELQKAIDASHEQMIATAELRKRMAPEYKTKCSYCSAPTGNKKLLTCSRCKLSYYCNRDCQMKHWPEHKKNCQEIHTSSNPQDKIPLFEKAAATTGDGPESQTAERPVAYASLNQLFDTENQKVRSIFDVDPNALIKSKK